MSQRMAHRAEQQAGHAAVAAASYHHDGDVGLAGYEAQGGGGRPLTDPKVDLDLRGVRQLGQ